MGKFGLVGGTGGSDNDNQSKGIPQKPDGVLVASGIYNEGTFVTYIEFSVNTDVFMHFGGNGSTNGPLDKYALQKYEHIVGITGRYGKYVDSVSIIVWDRAKSQERTIGPFGGPGGSASYYYVDHDTNIIGFWGRTGSWIDAIGIYTGSTFPPDQ